MRQYPQAVNSLQLHHKRVIHIGFSQEIFLHTAAIPQAGPISLVDVSGRLTSFEVVALREAISRLLKQDRKNIVLYLSGLQYLDSSGIGELAKIYVSVGKVSGQLKVVGLSPKVEESLKI